MVRKLFLKKMSGNPGDHSARGRDRKSIIKVLLKKSVQYSCVPGS